MSNIGDVYLCGDLNSRCGVLSDRVEHLGLGRFVDLPVEDDLSSPIAVKESYDAYVNVFSHKLISLCKEQDMLIVNVRLEPGRFTSITQAGASLVDRFISQTKNFSKIDNMFVSDLSEFSDHCSIEISLNIKFESPTQEFRTFDKFCWDSADENLLFNILETKRRDFDEATEAFCNDASVIDSKIILLTNIIYDVCFSVCGKTVRVKGSQSKKRKPAVWFNQDCKDSKSAFLNAKRTLKNSYSENNKIAFLEARSILVQTKRTCRARLKFQNEQKFKLADMSKRAPKQFWKKKIRNKKSSDTSDLTNGEFHDYFYGLMNNRNVGNNMDFSNLPDINTDVQDLDKPISEAEILKAIDSLKRGKSPGFDGVLNDFFLDAKEFIIPYLVKIYNKIYDSGIYPASWCKVSVYLSTKRGTRTIPIIIVE